MAETTLVLTSGTSRGRDTLGYNIVRVRDTSTGRLYRCMGGGYDMVGTVVADWLQDVHQDRLQSIADRAYATWGVAHPYTTHDEPGRLYGMTLNTTENVVHLDGACGLNSVERIAEAIGVKLTRATWDRNGNTRSWVASWA